MKKNLIIMLMALMLGAFYIPGALAAPPLFTMVDEEINSSGTITVNPLADPLASPSPTSYDFTTKSWTKSFSTAGSYFYSLFIDPEIDEAINTFYNEYGATFGTPASDQSWEIDEPGYVFGDIYDNFLAGTLDKTNGTLVNLVDNGVDPPYYQVANGVDPAFLAPSPTHRDDVSMALGWDFTLASNQTANLKFFLDTTAPTDGRFYLAQIDPDSPATLYFSSTLEVKDNGIPGVPEPGTLILLATGLAGLVGVGRRVKL